MPPRVKKLAQEIGAHVVTEGPEALKADWKFILSLLTAIVAAVFYFGHNDESLVSLRRDIQRNEAAQKESVDALRREMDAGDKATAETLKRMGDERLTLINNSAREKEGMHTDIRELRQRLDNCKSCK